MGVVFDRKLDYVLEVLCGYTIRKYNTIIVESLQTNYITDFEQFRMIEPTDLGTVLDMKKKKSTNKYYKYQKKTKQQQSQPQPKKKKRMLLRLRRVIMVSRKMTTMTTNGYRWYEQ